MSRYGSYPRWGGYGPRRTGRANEQALKHIEEARQFSAEVGGVDNDVKNFFFSLPAQELQVLLYEYGKRYGEDKRQYAEKTYPDWKLGSRKMSGLVAQRLFDLLPNRMPLPVKFQLVRKLWEHFCPKSHEVVYVGTGATSDVLHATVSAHFQKVVQDYYISDQLSKRFQWLSAGDAHVQQQLQNYFQQLKKDLLAQALQHRLHVIASYLDNSPEDHVVQSVRIGNHVVDIKCTHLADGVVDAATVNNIRQKNIETVQRHERLKSSLGCLIAVAVVFVLLKACAK
jgi:hypothetical protein